MLNNHQFAILAKIYHQFLLDLIKSRFNFRDFFFVFHFE